MLNFNGSLTPEPNRPESLEPYYAPRQAKV